MGGVMQKLNQELIDTILNELKNGEISIYYAAKKYNINHTTILWHIKKRKEFDHDYVVKKLENRNYIIKKPREPKIIKKLGTRKQKIIKPQAKNYKDYLKEENEKRKQKGWYIFKEVSNKKQVGLLA